MFRQLSAMCRQLAAMFSSFSLKLSGKLLYFLGIQLQVSLHILSGSLLITHLHQQIALFQQVLAQRCLVLSILAASFRPLLLLRYLLRKTATSRTGFISFKSIIPILFLVTHVAQNAPKGQKPQPRASPWVITDTNLSPRRAKALKYWAIYKAFALTGRLAD